MGETSEFGGVLVVVGVIPMLLLCTLNFVGFVGSGVLVLLDFRVVGCWYYCELRWYCELRGSH